jgi:monoamine oxidase
LAEWLQNNVLSKSAYQLLEAALAGVYTSAASEVSLLYVLYQMASGGGPNFVLGVKDPAEDARSPNSAIRSICRNRSGPSRRTPPA